MEEVLANPRIRKRIDQISGAELTAIFLLDGFLEVQVRLSCHGAKPVAEKFAVAAMLAREGVYVVCGRHLEPLQNRPEMVAITGGGTNKLKRAVRPVHRRGAETTAGLRLF